MKIPPSLLELRRDLREKAEGFVNWPGNEGAVAALTYAAVRLDAILESWAGTVLSLRQAAEASRYSSDHLGRLIREGVIPNAGPKNAPRIRRGDLPLKPGFEAEQEKVAPSAPDGEDKFGLFRDIINSKYGA